MASILVWSPNYAPEPIGIPPLVTQAAEWLVGQGHEVTVVTAVPNYPDRIIADGYGRRWRHTAVEAGVVVCRHWIRVRPEERFVDKALYEVSFAVSSAPTYAKLARRADVCVVVVPTVLAAATATHLPWRPRTVLWVQDIVSAAARSVEGVGESALRLAARLEGRAARRADHVIVCNPVFGTALGIHGDAHTILNWVDTCEIRATPLSDRSNGAAVRFLYAGNLGYTQGFETAVSAIGMVPKAELQIVGGGNAAAELRRIRNDRVTVQPSVAREDLSDLLSSADVLLVLQRRVSAGANFPSKIATYLAAGRPILAAIDGGTAAAALIRSSGGGFVVPPENPDALAEAMTLLRDDVELRAELGASARRYAEQELSMSALLPRLERAILG